MASKKKQHEIDREMGEKLYKLTEDMTKREYIRLVKIILEFIKVNAISIEYVSMLFREIGEALEMEDFSDELLDIHNFFERLDSELEVPTITIEEFIDDIEKLFIKIK